MLELRDAVYNRLSLTFTLSAVTVRLLLLTVYRSLTELYVRSQKYVRVITFFPKIVEGQCNDFR